MEDPHASSPPKAQFVVLDQTFVVFDIDQPNYACQKLKLNRLAGVGPIYWRFQTNAPTRYIVSPNRGVIRDDEPVEVSVILYKNRFRPLHELVLQAVKVPDTGNFDVKKLFEDPEVSIQVTNLDLGTTVMKIDSAVESQKSLTDLTQALDESAISGAARLEELQSILNLTNADTDQIKSNIAQAKQLKLALEAQLEQKKALVADFQSKRSIVESSFMRKSAECRRLENELQNQRKIKLAKLTATSSNEPQPKTSNNCSIS